MDLLLQRFFETDRWTAAIAKAYDKGICKADLLALTYPETRAAIYEALVTGTYHIAPPHTALIPKDKPGEFRTVYINEPIDRVVLSIANDILFETCPSMVHPSCRSYQKGVGCGKVVLEASRRISASDGWKSDLSKYFDSVPIRYIDEAFDKVEALCGHSAVVDMLRRYYHSDLYFDHKGNLVQGYQSLKQGCSVASFLADVILYDIDQHLSNDFGGFYQRYSDDMAFIGDHHQEAMAYLRDALAEKGMSLNPKKVEAISADRWWQFLGFSIKGDAISLSPHRIKKFQKEVSSKAFHARSGKSAVSAVNRFLYGRGDGFSWATSVLPIINVKADIDTLNAYTMDCLRAAATGRKHIGGLGYSTTLREGCVTRGCGHNVTSNRQRTDKAIDGYRSLRCMRNALLTNKEAYAILARTAA